MNTATRTLEVLNQGRKETNLVMACCTGGGTTKARQA